PGGRDRDSRSGARHRRPRHTAEGASFGPAARPGRARRRAAMAVHAEHVRRPSSFRAHDDHRSVYAAAMRGWTGAVLALTLTSGQAAIPTGGAPQPPPQTAGPAQVPAATAPTQAPVDDLLRAAIEQYY